MRGAVGAERLLLHRQQLAAFDLPSGDRRTVVGLAGGGPAAVARVAAIEARPLAQPAILLSLLAGGRRRGQRLQQPLAAGAGGVEGPALDQAFDRPFVDRARVDPFAEIPDRGDRAVLAGVQDRLYRRVADV